MRYGIEISIVQSYEIISLMHIGLLPQIKNSNTGKTSAVKEENILKTIND